jgi:hypothetical protein
LQDIYDSLLNDKFFIGLTNVFADLIEHLGNFIDALGGAGGLLSTLGTIALKVFGKDIKKSISDTTFNIKGLLGLNKEADKAMKADAAKLSSRTLAELDTLKGNVEADNIKDTARLQMVLIENEDKLTQEQKLRLQGELDINKALQERRLLTAKEIEEQEKIIQQQQRKIKFSSGNQKEVDKKQIDDLKKMGATQGLLQDVYNNAEAFKKPKRARNGASDLEKADAKESREA